MRTYTYQSTNPLARANPLRSIPFMRPASALWHPTTLPDEPAPVAAAPVNPTRELANAEALLRECVRVYDAARAGIGEANATGTKAVVVNGHVVRPAQAYTKERIRERKSYAFKLFNKRRGELSRARRRVDAALAALGQQSLALTAARAAVASEVRASKRRPVVHHPIAQAALSV
jgi:hypothetical protein